MPFSKNRRFRDGDLLRRLFETVLQRCIDEGLGGGQGFAVDASLIQADASDRTRVEALKLRRASEMTGCTSLGKAEFLNPGGSVKDRAALFIIKDAEERGLLRPGGVIVEGTAGNTGIGLALVGTKAGLRSKQRVS